MVRSPCCDKMGLKKGPWTPEEDQVLVSFIQRCGHGNWRALPRQAGKLQASVSSLKKRTRPSPVPGNKARPSAAAAVPSTAPVTDQSKQRTTVLLQVLDPAAACTPYGGPSGNTPSSPPPSTTGEGSCTATESSSPIRRDTNPASVREECTEYSSEMFVEMDESFWSGALSLESSVTSMGFFEKQQKPPGACQPPLGHVGGDSHHADTASNEEDDMDFWLRVLMGVGGLPSS